MEYVSLNNTAPDFISRHDISTMSDEQLDKLIDDIKLRRMASFYIYEQTQADMQALQEEKAKVALEKEITQILKVLDTVDRNLEKLETRIHKLRGLRIQAGLSIL